MRGRSILRDAGINTSRVEILNEMWENCDEQIEYY